MWFGTEYGLNRYDGYTFTVFKYNEEKKNSLSNNHILSIYEDRAGIIWIGTKGGGLNKYDREKEEFINFKNDPGDINSLSNNIVTSICEDNAGTLWIGTDGGGLNKLEKAEGDILGIG
jgi:ligand-binding sensor domain-containing protein